MSYGATLCSQCTVRAVVDYIVENVSTTDAEPGVTFSRSLAALMPQPIRGRIYALIYGRLSTDIGEFTELSRF